MYAAIVKAAVTLKAPTRNPPQFLIGNHFD